MRNYCKAISRKFRSIFARKTPAVLWVVFSLVSWVGASSVTANPTWQVGSHEVLFGDFDTDGNDDLYLKGKPELFFLQKPVYVPLEQPGAADVVLLGSANGNFFVVNGLNVDASLGLANTHKLRVHDFIVNAIHF